MNLRHQTFHPIAIPLFSGLCSSPLWLSFVFAPGLRAEVLVTHPVNAPETAVVRFSDRAETADVANALELAASKPPSLGRSLPDSFLAETVSVSPQFLPVMQPDDRLPAPAQISLDRPPIPASQNTSSHLQAQSVPPTSPPNSTDIRRQGSRILGTPSIQLQGVLLNQGDEFSARARAAATYAISPNSLFGAVVDLTTGNAFSDSPVPGLRLNELYFATSPATVPNLRFVVGLMDLTSYFDRNSFAKDGASHFFNRAFQTNPALSAAGLESRIGALVNWNVTDNFELKAAGFSSSRSLGDLALDGFAGEAGLRFGNVIVRGTYVTDRDAGRRTGFEEIFDIPRRGRSGPQSGDRENAYGINAEAFIPKLKLGLFGRYGHYENTALDSGADTYSFGVSRLDLFMRDDRLGLAYGRQLSNDDLRRQRDDKVPDVLELYYDFRLTSFLRAGVTLQERNQFSETVVGFRLKTEFDVSPRR